MKYPSIYICQFSDKTVKIGRGTSPKKRIADHRARGEVFNISLDKIAILPVFNIERAEAALVEWCADRCALQVHREWFHGINFDACHRFAKEVQAANTGPVAGAEQAKSEVVPNRIFDVLFPGLSAPSFVPSTTYCGIAYSEARQRLSGHEPFSGQILSALDFIHEHCEFVRLEMTRGMPVPDWFHLLNICGDWEVEMFFYDIANPEPEFFRALADAMESITAEKMVAP